MSKTECYNFPSIWESRNNVLDAMKLPNEDFDYFTTEKLEQERVVNVSLDDLVYKIQFMSSNYKSTDS